MKKKLCIWILGHFGRFWLSALFFKISTANYDNIIMRPIRQSVLAGCLSTIFRRLLAKSMTILVWHIILRLYAVHFQCNRGYDSLHDRHMLIIRTLNKRIMDTVPFFFQLLIKASFKYSNSRMSEESRKLLKVSPSLNKRIFPLHFENWFLLYAWCT